MSAPNDITGAKPGGPRLYRGRMCRVARFLQFWAFGRMTPAAKCQASKYGFTVAALGFVTGGMLNCDCPGWFVCTGIAAVFPAVLGTRVSRIAGVCLCIASFTFAVAQFNHERAREFRIKQARERALESSQQR